ncbi:hypothetical protein ACH4VR_27440 [Streptomyces sp. NPDC020883]
MRLHAALGRLTTGPLQRPRVRRLAQATGGALVAPGAAVGFEVAR